MAPRVYAYNGTDNPKKATNKEKKPSMAEQIHCTFYKEKNLLFKKTKQSGDYSRYKLARNSTVVVLPLNNNDLDVSKNNRVPE